MQVQSALDPPNKLALGEAAVQVDGVDSNLLLLKQDFWGVMNCNDG